MTSTIDLQAAYEHFLTVDTTMATLLRDGMHASEPIAIPYPKPTEHYFMSIVSSIISQQISTKAADAVRGRVVELLSDPITPTAVLHSDHDTLKACGLSNQKTRYIIHNANVWHRLPVETFKDLSDEDIIKELTALYGIGRWTAEMFLMFSMARPNVFSYGDLGLMQSLYENYGYYPHYKRKIRSTVDRWSPHQTAASLALWFVKDNGPVLL